VIVLSSWMANSTSSPSLMQRTPPQQQQQQQWHDSQACLHRLGTPGAAISWC
jgi:hypothetical protein